MVDPAILRDNASVVRAALQSRGVDLTAELEELATLETARRQLLPDLEGLKRDQNKASEEAARALEQTMGDVATFEGRAFAEVLRDV